jgi:hypothetical protein
MSDGTEKTQNQQKWGQWQILSLTQTVSHPGTQHLIMALLFSISWSVIVIQQTHVLRLRTLAFLVCWGCTPAVGSSDVGWGAKVIGVVSVFALAEPKVAEGVALHGFGSLALGRLNGVGRLGREGVVEMGVHEGGDGTKRPGRVGAGSVAEVAVKTVGALCALEDKSWGEGTGRLGGAGVCVCVPAWGKRPVGKGGAVTIGKGVKRVRELTEVVNKVIILVVLLHRTLVFSIVFPFLLFRFLIIWVLPLVVALIFCAVFLIFGRSYCVLTRSSHQ